MKLTPEDRRQIMSSGTAGMRAMLKYFEDRIDDLEKRLEASLGQLEHQREKGLKRK